MIAAERDTFTPVDVVRALAERIPGAEYLELAGASHAAPIERAQAINEHIDEFLERIALGADATRSAREGPRLRRRRARALQY